MAANEHEKLIFPEYTPVLDKSDDRVAAITAIFRHQIQQIKVPIDQMEIEAKLGQLTFKGSHGVLPSELTKFIQNKPTWDILPSQKLFGSRAFYEFESGLFCSKSAQQRYQSREMFGFMLDRCRMQTQRNPYFKLVDDRKKTKDEIYSNGSRATF